VGSEVRNIYKSAQNSCTLLIFQAPEFHYNKHYYLVHQFSHVTYWEVRVYSKWNVNYVLCNKNLHGLWECKNACVETLNFTECTLWKNI